MTSSGMASFSRAHRFPSSSHFDSLQPITRQLESDESPRGLAVCVFPRWPMQDAKPPPKLSYEARSHFGDIQSGLTAMLWACCHR
jgi:hypothetical protein